MMLGLFGKTARPAAPQQASGGASCFGKLPLHGDFIRHNLQLREARALEQWLQEGVGWLARKYPAGWPEPCRNFPCCHFLQSGGEQERTLIGVLAPGRDRSGRHYPVVLFTHSAERLFHEMRALPPLVYRDFLAAADAVCRHDWQDEPLAQLLQRVDGLETALPPLQRRPLLAQQIELLQAVPMADFWEGIAPELDADERERLFQTLFNALRTVARRSAAHTPWGLRLPIPSAGDQSPAVIFWLQLVESILEDRTWRAHCFWSREPQQPYSDLTLFFRPLPASFLPALLNAETDVNTTFDLMREWPSLQEFRSRVDLKRLLSDPQASLLDVLYRVGRREVLA